MDRLFKLRSDLAPSAEADGDDVNLAKHFLADTGDFEVPDYGITKYPDAPYSMPLRISRVGTN